MLKRDIIILGCIGILILFLSKSVVESYNAVKAIEYQESENTEDNPYVVEGENNAFDGLQELSEKAKPKKTGFMWDINNFVAEDGANVSIDELNSLLCYYFMPREDMDKYVEDMVKKLFGKKKNIKKEIGESLNTGWGKLYNYSYNSDYNDAGHRDEYMLTGDAMGLDFTKIGGNSSEKKDYEAMAQLQDAVDILKLGLYDKNGKSFMTINQVTDNKYNCGYLFNEVELSQFAYGESEVDGVTYAKIQPIEFYFKDNNLYAIYHMISHQYEKEEKIESSYKDWDEILQIFQKNAQEYYKKEFGKDYGNQFFHLQITGLKCAYEGGFVKGKDAKMLAVPAVELSAVEDKYSFEKEEWERHEICFALNLKTGEITRQYGIL